MRSRHRDYIRQGRDAMSLPIPVGVGRFVLPGNRWDLLAGVEPLQPPTVSVVVPYFADQKRLDLLLAALSMQSHPRERLEVIVADDGSPTSPCLAELRGVDGRIVRQEDLGFRAGAARNLGVAASTGEILVFLDADTYPEPDYITRLVRLPALAPEAMVTGRRRHADFTGWMPGRLVGWMNGRGDGPPELTEPAWLRDEHRRSGNLLEIGEHSYRYVISAVLACSRYLFDTVGGFDETLVGYGGEDWEFAYRALGRGALLAHVADAVAWHDGPDWAERGNSDERQRQKAAETAALAERIPDFIEVHSNGHPSVIVEISTGVRAADEWVAPLQSWLNAEANLAVAVAGPMAELLKQTYFRAEPRVSRGPIEENARARARIIVTLDQPAAPDPQLWTELREQFEKSEVGRVIVHTEEGSLVATATRAAGRSERWRDVVGNRNLFDRLFSTINL
jgi:GT2 family glycosyltransferase